VRAVVLVVSSFVVPGWAVGGLYVEGRRRRVRRRSGRGVLTRGRVVYASFDGVHVSVRDAVLSERVVVLSVPNEGSRGWVRRRWGWVVLTRIHVVYASFDGVYVGVHDAVLFELVVALPVPNEGRRGWG
jgi:hypothetical protein